MLRPFRGMLPQVDPSVDIDQDGTIVHVMRDTHPTRVGDEVTNDYAAGEPGVQGAPPSDHG